MKRFQVIQMTHLSRYDVAKFEQDGCLLPLTIMDEVDALELRRQLEAAERFAGDDSRLKNAIKAGGNQVLPFLADLCRDPRITDPVASVLGEDLLLWACSLFVKEPGSDSFISWHQDVHYWGLEEASEVTAWLALSPATLESGCMKFVPGSHKTRVAHRDTFAVDNMLTRGQEIAVEVDDADTVEVNLRPGQMSLHHGLTFHASGPNRSADRRIGIALRFVPTSNRQEGNVRTLATLARGEDRFGHFDLTPIPAAPFEPEALERFERGQALSRSILLRGAGM